MDCKKSRNKVKGPKVCTQQTVCVYTRGIEIAATVFSLSHSPTDKRKNSTMHSAQNTTKPSAP